MITDSDIRSIWVNDDNIDLCEYCIKFCAIGAKCEGFEWNGVIPKGYEVAEKKDEIFKILPVLQRFRKDLI